MVETVRIFNNTPTVFTKRYVIAKKYAEMYVGFKHYSSLADAKRVGALDTDLVYAQEHKNGECTVYFWVDTSTGQALIDCDIAFFDCLEDVKTFMNINIRADCEVHVITFNVYEECIKHEEMYKVIPKESLDDIKPRKINLL